MGNYKKEIMDLLKKNFVQVVGNKKFQTGSEACSYYLFALKDNLYKPMNEKALLAYGNGSGNEIFSGKMNALRSSSALTYNLFWDQVAQIKNENRHFGKGVYQVEFEKQYHTLKPTVSNRPANLDAFLYCEDTCEAIACEMKMMEWIFNGSHMLKKAYLDPYNYKDEEAGKIFAGIAEKLIVGSKDSKLEKYPCKMKVYDAFQMFKHAVACYNACSFEDEEPREIKKLTLVNCVWTLPEEIYLSDKASQKYMPGFDEEYASQEKKERDEFDEFDKIMKPVKTLFQKKDIDVTFDIQFYTFIEFLRLFNKTQNELNYLKRYTF